MTLISLSGPVLGKKIILICLMQTKMLTYHPSGHTLKTRSSFVSSASYTCIYALFLLAK